VAPLPRLGQLVSGVDLEGLEARVNALPASSRAKAAWFMDVDGVLNVIGRPPRHGWGRYEHVVVQAFDGIAWPICYSTTLIRLLNVLHAKGVVSFRWLTTWEHDAPKKFAPAVGLDIGRWIAGEDLGTGGTWWKLDVIVENLADATELMIWTDDDIKRFHHARRVVDFLHPEQAVVICPDETRGLTPEDFDIILSAIEKAVAE
jgi:hypothetical protein